MEPSDRLGQDRKSLTECMGYLFANHLHADTRFMFRPLEDRQIVLEAHRLILAARSVVFEAMLYGSMATDQPIRISDIEPDIFREMLRYVYTDEIKLTEGNVIPLLYSSNKYLLAGLSENCLAFLSRALDGDSVCDILSSVLFYKESGTPVFKDQCMSLIKKCIQLVKPRANDVLHSERFLQLPAEAIAIILPDDELVVEGETLVYSAILKWVKHQCGLSGDGQEVEAYRKRLGDLLYHIRFTVLLDELLKGESEALIADALDNVELLSAEERQSLERYKRTKAQDGFVSRLKKTHRYKFCVCQRYDEVTFGEDGWKCEGYPDPVGLSCSEDIYLLGVGVYGPRHSQGSFTIKITVNKHGDDITNLPILQGEIETKSLTSTGQKEPYKVYFSSPVFIKGEDIHTVYLMIEGQPSFFGRGGRERVCAHGVVFSFISSSKKRRRNKTDTRTGQIPQLLFRL